MIKGKKFKYFEMLNFWLSFTIQQPQNKFTAKKWIQNNNKNAFSENKPPRIISSSFDVDENTTLIGSIEARDRDGDSIQFFSSKPLATLFKTSDSVLRFWKVPVPCAITILSWIEHPNFNVLEIDWAIVT